MKPLVINRRLMTKLGKAVYAATADADCTCCDDDDNPDTDTCSDKCKLGEDQPWGDPELSCCLPSAVLVSLSGISAVSGCQDFYWYCPSPATCRYFMAWTASGSLSGVNICCKAGTGSIAPPAGGGTLAAWYAGLIDTRGMGLTLRLERSDEVTRKDCDGGEIVWNRDYVIRAAQVYVFLYSDRGDGQPGFDIVVYGTCVGSVLGVGDLFFNGALLFQTAREEVVVGDETKMLPPAIVPCKSASAEGITRDAFYLTEEGHSGLLRMFFAYLGGSATLKPCCDAKDAPTIPDCSAPVPQTWKWYGAVQCGDNPLDYVWEREDRLDFAFSGGDRTKVYGDFRSGGGGCFFFSKTLSLIRTVPPDEEPPFYEWLWTGAAVYDDCAACAANSAVYLRARDCDGDGLLNVVVANNDDVSADDGTAYILPGTCIYFNLADAVSTLPDGAEILDINDFASAESCETCVGSLPCPTDNDGCSATYTGTFTPSGDCATTAGITSKAGTLDAKGDGTWRYSQYPDTEGDDGSGITLLCSGKYYLAIVGDLVEAAGYSATFRKLRTGPCPPTGEYEFVSASAVCDWTGATLTIS